MSWWQHSAEYCDLRDYSLQSVYLYWYRGKLCFLSGKYKKKQITRVLIRTFPAYDEMNIDRNDNIEYISHIHMCNLPHPRATKQSAKEMVPRGVDTGCDLKRYTVCRAADTTVVFADTRLKG